MSSRRRTLCFVLSLLSLNNGLITCLPEGPVLTQHCPCPGPPPQHVHPLSTVQGPHTAFPTRFNDVFSFGSFYPGLSINTVATTNFAAPKPLPITNPPVASANPLPIVETITETLPYPSNVESVTIVENYPSVPQTLQVEGIAPTANVAEIYQTPITVQIPAKPQTTPFVAVAPPFPEILPPKNKVQEIFTPTVVPKTPPEIVETKVTTVTSTPVEPTALNIPSGSLGQQLPVTLQINLPSVSWNPEPVIAVMSPPAPAPSPCSTFNPSFEMPQAPPPIIVLEKSKSKWKSILPILMLSLFDGGCGNSGGGSCSQCSASTPVPFPIVIPTNNPVITRCRGKGKN